jgi:hypothetical protein
MTLEQVSIYAELPPTSGEYITALGRLEYNAKTKKFCYPIANHRQYTIDTEAVEWWLKTTPNEKAEKAV